jgi:hypothetical protein
MGYSCPVNHVAYSLLLKNGFWAIPCIWIDPATAASLEQQPNTFAIPLGGLPNGWPYGQPCVADSSAPTPHPFGPPSVASNNLLGNLSAEDTAFLMNASFTFLDEPTFESFSFGTQGMVHYWIIIMYNANYISPDRWRCPATALPTS